MLNIDDPKEVETTPAIFRLGFRPFFLGGAFIAALYIPLWLMGWFTPRYSLFNGEFWANVIPLWWHPHEMLFGFAMAIVCGFLLTAVQTWTHQKTVKGAYLAVIFSCWLLARLLLLLPFNIPLVLPAIFDTAFLGLSAAVLWRCIYRVKQWRNIGFPLMLMLAMLVNLLSYYALYQRDFSLSTHIWQAMIWWVAVVITIVGGRVIPFFTAIRIKQPKPEPIKQLDGLIIILMMLLFTQALTHWMSTNIEQILLAVTGILQLARLSRWQGHKTLQEPLLWSMHLSYLALPVTLLAMAWQIDNVYAYKTLLHLFAISGLASLCLSMMSRVSLGHTSRNIYEGPSMALAFACIPAAGVFRAIMPLLMPVHTQVWLWMAGACWFIGFGMFVWFYAPVLTKPRIDGRPG
ncbi:NnrS family protein [Shewanella intestini]|uniref:NnrS family protein n=1 Tax=Shewanella intestini TaxID=2017544 RepID=A0ABS5HXT7_9GAMM|nr:MULTISPECIES: NnrS family protein [Shewanella]MBR9726577.1 NnrS family protein [Shewanella intestini]MRG34857.1 NnrS family protein [Shewanella sp. XMDDZSB0408]